MSDPPENSVKRSGMCTGLGTKSHKIAKPWGKGFGGLTFGEAYVVLDLPNDGTAESIEVTIILEPLHHLTCRRRPLQGAATRITHGNEIGKCRIEASVRLEASVPSFAVNGEHGL